MNNIYVICNVRLEEPYAISISTIYTIGIIKGWRLLYASTNSDYAKIAIGFDLFKEYYKESPKVGKMYEPIPGTKKIIDHIIVEEFKDFKV